MAYELPMSDAGAYPIDYIMVPRRSRIGQRGPGSVDTAGADGAQTERACVDLSLSRDWRTCHQKYF